jgi:hypothetical protein
MAASELPQESPVADGDATTIDGNGATTLQFPECAGYNLAGRARDPGHV